MIPKILSSLANKDVMIVTMLTAIASCLILLTFNSFVIITALFKIVECLEKIAGKF
jgi:hypothetical protein